MTTTSGLVMPDNRLVGIPTMAKPVPTGELKVDRETTWAEDGLSEKDIPAPVGWRVMIEPIEVKKVTKGGIHLPEQTQDAQEYMRYVGLVVGIGPGAYMHRKFEGQAPWCQVGDWIIHGKYAGQEVMIQGTERIHSFRFVNDDEILAVTDCPEKCILYAGIG